MVSITYSWRYYLEVLPPFHILGKKYKAQNGKHGVIESGSGFVSTYKNNLLEQKKRALKCCFTIKRPIGPKYFS
jgi:hypothetical protein